MDIFAALLFLVLALLIISYLALQLKQTQQALDKTTHTLTQRNRDLKLSQELSLVIQSSADLSELQETILHSLVHEIGYRRASIALYNEGQNSLSGWMTAIHPSYTPLYKPIPYDCEINLAQEKGPLGQAMRQRKIIEIDDNTPLAKQSDLCQYLVSTHHYVIMPLSLREHLLGVLIVDGLSDNDDLSLTDGESFTYLTTHAGVALGSLRLCIDRTRRNALTTERNRIAADLHDNVSQTLYGLAYGLDACTQMLPHEPQVQNTLKQMHHTVTGTQAKLRQSIFNIRAEAVTADAFVGGLHRHLRTVSPTHTTALSIDIPGDFDQWEAITRNHLYRLAQEALANAAKHAEAQDITLRLYHTEQEIILQIQDNGHGFAVSDVDNTQKMGLQGMYERVNSLHGTLNIDSTVGHGTSISISIPFRAAHQLEEDTLPAFSQNHTLQQL